MPSEDAYTQERALLGEVLPRVEAGELWIMDRNFCTKGCLWGLHQRGAVGLIREHEQLRFKPLEAIRSIGEIDSGRVAMLGCPNTLQKYENAGKRRDPQYTA